MPRPGGRGPSISEKPKDFFGSIIKLFKNLKKWNVIIIIALLLGFLSAILSLLAPDKLSDFANEIQKGLVPNTTKLVEIGQAISTNVSNEKLTTKIKEINDSDISEEDKESYTNILNQILSAEDEETKTWLLLTLPDNILEYLFDNITIDGVTITPQDQFQMLSLSQEISTSTDTQKTYELLDKLPESIYSLVKPTIDLTAIKKIIIFMVTIYLLSSIFSYIQAYSMTTVSNEFARKLRSNISSKINKLPLKYFDSHETGDILSRVTNDVDSIAQNLNNSLATLISSLTLFIGSIIMMFITNYIMAITAILSTIIGFVLMFIILNKSQRYFEENQRVLGELNGYIEEIYSGHNVVKAYNGTEEALLTFDDLNKQLYKAKRNSIFLSGTMQPIMGFVGNFGYVAVCIVGALLTMNNLTSFGTIVAFMIYIRMFTNPLSQIAQAMTNLQTTVAASERVFEFMEEPEMSDENNIKEVLPKEQTSGLIEFKNVKFGYDPNKTIIKNFSSIAKPGQKIAIVGPTGAGKTTMVNLLMKFYEIDGGDIIIDGHSTKNLTRENVHDLFCMVLQDTWLFKGTIRDNIKFNNQNVTDEQIWNALKVVGIDHFVKTLSGGLDAEITDSGEISQGQKQLLTIARGMIEDAPFLILDEATSNVDTRTEELVQKAMDKLTEGRTSFIIAHRLSTIKNADTILVMKDGNIIEQGSHDELMKQKGFYADLYNSQFEL